MSSSSSSYKLTNRGGVVQVRGVPWKTMYFYWPSLVYPQALRLRGYGCIVYISHTRSSQPTVSSW
eukprot:4748800-Prymnesium_polylepis.1